MRVAEAAVLLQLAVNGIHVYASPFDNDSVDFVVQVSTGELKRLSVRWAKRSRTGRAAMSLTRVPGGRKHVRISGVDFFCAYDSAVDAVYVWSAEELRQYSRLVSMDEDARGRWDKVRG